MVKTDTDPVRLGKFKPSFLNSNVYEAYADQKYLNINDSNYHIHMHHAYNLRIVAGEEFRKERYKIGVFKKQRE